MIGRGGTDSSNITNILSPFLVSVYFPRSVLDLCQLNRWCSSKENQQVSVDLSPGKGTDVPFPRQDFQNSPHRLQNILRWCTCISVDGYLGSIGLPFFSQVYIFSLIPFLSSTQHLTGCRCTKADFAEAGWGTHFTF